MNRRVSQKKTIPYFTENDRVPPSALSIRGAKTFTIGVFEMSGESAFPKNPSVKACVGEPTYPVKASLTRKKAAERRIM